MSNAQPQPSILQTHESLDAGQASSSSSSTPSTAPSTPSIFDDCPRPLEEHSLRSSMTLPIAPPTVNVQFAPLPEISPRGRKSNHPLGVAARSRMIQQKRNLRAHPEWSDPDDRPMVYIPDETQEDDVLDAFVRFIGDKSKSLWKRVISKAKQSDKEEPTAAASDSNSETTNVAEEQKAVQTRPPNREMPSTLDSHLDNPAGQAKGISKRASDRVAEIPQ